MSKYRRGRREVEELTRDSIPIPNLDEDFTWMQVGSGSRMRNLLFYAINAMTEGKSVVWTGSGSSVGKAVSCAEILKRKFNANQITKICYRTVEEYWEPHFTTLETLIVKREIPVIHILVSQKNLDPNELGYQTCFSYHGLWSPNRPRTGTCADRNVQRGRRRPNFLKHICNK